MSEAEPTFRPEEMRSCVLERSEAMERRVERAAIALVLVRMLAIINVSLVFTRYWSGDIPGLVLPVATFRLHATRFGNT
ncbi:hypothetical protein D3C71_1734350 [compost metagenome]